MLTKILHKLKNYRRLKPLELSAVPALFSNKNGIEVGGPSALFREELPIYREVKNLDGCNFSGNTLWEGTITEGLTYNYREDKVGYQYISEASKLEEVADNKYDFLLASHCLEHCANCLKTVAEWIRVVKRGGYILLVLPDKEHTFDHKRPVTTFRHLLEDLKNGVDERDLTHYDEIISLHDLTMDLPAGDIEQFRKRSLDNFNNRCLHQHVFDFSLLEQVCVHFKLKVKGKWWIGPYHQVILTQKPSR